MYFPCIAAGAFLCLENPQPGWGFSKAFSFGSAIKNPFEDATDRRCSKLFFTAVSLLYFLFPFQNTILLPVFT